MTPAERIYREAIRETASYFKLTESIVKAIVNSTEPLDEGAQLVFHYYKWLEARKAGPVIGEHYARVG